MEGGTVSQAIAETMARGQFRCSGSSPSSRITRCPDSRASGAAGTRVDARDGSAMVFDCGMSERGQPYCVRDLPQRLQLVRQSHASTERLREVQQWGKEALQGSHLP